MPAVIKILGWKAQGLRCPDHEINCCNSAGEPYKISLIQMPNGTGKTTALSLLRAALSGAAQQEEWNQATINEFRKKGNGADTSGTFEVRLLLNNRRATILMYFDFENGRVSYKTTYGQGQQVGFHPPGEFRRFLNLNFVSFFVFDGELAQRLLNRTQTNAEAVVEALFQISTFSILQERVREYWTNQTRASSAKEERGLARRENRVDSLERRIAQLTREKSALEAKRADIAARLKRKEELYTQEIKKDEVLGKDLNRAMVTVEQRKAAVREDAAAVLNAMRDPYALSAIFAGAMAQLKAGLDKVKLPDSAAREFFNELADESECVCGRPIDEQVKETIRQRANQYLASDDVLFLNAMKTAIHEAVGASTEAPETALNTRVSELDTAVSNERDALNALDALQVQAEQADPAVRKAKEEIEALETELNAVTDDLEKYESKDAQANDENTYGIEVLEKRLRDAERKLAEIRGTMELKAKRDILVRILNDAHRQARAAITKEICNEANKRIRELMPYNNISIQRIDRSLVLQGQEGGSVGETLSIAYAFLSTLFNRSDHQLPFVVDSPAGPIDLAVRPKIADLIPRLTHQFIAFTISSERERFVPRLVAASNADVQLLTLFRKGSKDLQRAACAAADVSETPDGFIVGGETFFNDFQLDEEVS